MIAQQLFARDFIWCNALAISAGAITHLHALMNVHCPFCILNFATKNLCRRVCTCLFTCCLHVCWTMHAITAPLQWKCTASRISTTNSSRPNTALKQPCDKCQAWLNANDAKLIKSNAYNLFVRCPIDASTTRTRDNTNVHNVSHVCLRPMDYSNKTLVHGIGDGINHHITADRLWVMEELNGRIFRLFVQLTIDR